MFWTDLIRAGRLSRERFTGCLSIFLLLLPLALEAQTAPDSAHRLLETTLEQLGGKARLQTVAAIRTKGIRTQNLLEQSERFEGPWLRNVFDFEEVCDFRVLEHRVVTRIRGDQFADWTKAEFSFAFRDGLHRKGNPFLQTAQESAERLSQDPLRLLLLAETATDLRTGKTVLQHRVPCQPLLFTVGKTPCTVFLNRFTHLPMSVETVSLRQDFWSVWGDVITRTEYNNWQTLPSGWHYPFSWTVTRNGLPHLMTTFTEVIIEATSEPLPSAQDDYAQIQSAFRTPKSPAPFVFRSRTVAEGIEQFPGGFNTHVIELPEGLVLLEPINTSEFNEAFLMELGKRFPGKSVCAVIATDDSWPHCGGLRPYVARGVPVYALGGKSHDFAKHGRGNASPQPRCLATHPSPPRDEACSREGHAGTRYQPNGIAPRAWRGERAHDCGLFSRATSALRVGFGSADAGRETLQSANHSGTHGHGSSREPHGRAGFCHALRTDYLEIVGGSPDAKSCAARPEQTLSAVLG